MSANSTPITATSATVVPFTRPARDSMREVGSDSTFTGLMPLAAGLSRVVAAHERVSCTARAATLIAMAVDLLRAEHGELGGSVARVLLGDVIGAGDGAGADGAGVGCQKPSPSVAVPPSGPFVTASTADTA